jgi:hypothetical protein
VFISLAGLFVCLMWLAVEHTFYGRRETKTVMMPEFGDENPEPKEKGVEVSKDD